MSMRLVVTKSSPPALVVPSKPTPGGNLPLTSTDKSRLFVSFASLMVFERPIHEPAETIRRALSHALVYYYPVAGRMVAAGAGGDVHLACTGEGVAFASATAIGTLQDISFLHASPELSLRYGGGGRCGMSDPLAMIQVTQFACGGYVLAVTWNHGLADASGIAQFLQAVGELARGLPSPAVVPIRYDESFPDIPQLMSALRRRAPAGHESSQHLADYAYTDVTIPWSFINRVKAEFRRTHAGCGACTAFEAVTAAVWQCRTRAINNAADAPAPLVFSANVRTHVGIADGYYGNCVSSQLVVATSGAVASGDIVDVVKLIKDAKERIPESLVRRKMPELDDGGLVGALCGYSVLRVSCWSRVGLDAVDFGGGTPERVVPDLERKRSPLCFPCLPCARNDRAGANVVAFCVTEEHVHEFHAQLARLQ
ncbi:unnamed protein product [Urochloa decumbens]|uniref:Uncharacterized protein n=1 Tax=Urochloa decumbens TaxID=240449 RepID=A0ABC9C7I3_9POAL